MIQNEKAFPKSEFIIKEKNLQSPWMSNGLIKSSKRKQKLYEKCIKKRTYENEMRYKNHKNLFEEIKHQSKKLFYTNSIAKASGNTKKHGIS